MVFIDLTATGESHLRLIRRGGKRSENAPKRAKTKPMLVGRLLEEKRDATAGTGGFLTVREEKEEAVCSI